MFAATLICSGLHPTPSSLQDSHIDSALPFWLPLVTPHAIQNKDDRLAARDHRPDGRNHLLLLRRLRKPAVLFFPPRFYHAAAQNRPKRILPRRSLFSGREAGRCPLGSPSAWCLHLGYDGRIFDLRRVRQTHLASSLAMYFPVSGFSGWETPLQFQRFLSQEYRRLFIIVKRKPMSSIRTINTLIGTALKWHSPICSSCCGLIVSTPAAEQIDNAAPTESDDRDRPSSLAVDSVSSQLVGTVTSLPLPVSVSAEVGVIHSVGFFKDDGLFYRPLHLCFPDTTQFESASASKSSFATNCVLHTWPGHVADNHKLMWFVSIDLLNVDRPAAPFLQHLNQANRRACRDLRCSSCKSRSTVLVTRESICAGIIVIFAFSLLKRFH